MAACVGTAKLEARSLCRNLERHGVVKCIMEDEGRQRVTKYVAWEYEGQSELSLKFEEEKKKIMELSRKYNIGGVSNTPLINGGRNRAKGEPFEPLSLEASRKESVEGSVGGGGGGVGNESITDLSEEISAERGTSGDEKDDPSVNILNNKLVADKRSHHHQKRDNPHVTYRCGSCGCYVGLIQCEES